jgi:hypothetical protein
MFSKEKIGYALEIFRVASSTRLIFGSVWNIPTLPNYIVSIPLRTQST